MAAETVLHSANPELANDPSSQRQTIPVQRLEVLTPEILTSGTEPAKGHSELETTILHVQATGDRAALWQLALRYRPELLNWARWRVSSRRGDRISHEDLVNDAIAKVVGAFKKRGEYNEYSAEELRVPQPYPRIGYFMTVVRTMLLDHRKSSERSYTKPVAEIDEVESHKGTPRHASPGPETIVVDDRLPVPQQIASDAIRTILAAVATENMKAAVVAYFTKEDDLRGKEIADTYGVSYGALKTAATRVRHRAHRLKQRGLLPLLPPLEDF